MSSLYLLMICLVLCLHTAVSMELCSVEGSSRIVNTVSFDDDDSAGRVEVCHNGVWGTVATTASVWSEKNAQVACRAAGSSGALNSIFPNGLSQSDRASSETPVHYFVTCDGSEGNLSQCQLDNSTVSSLVLSPGVYNHFFDAFIVCRPQTTDYSSVHSAGVQAGDIRLYGDTRNGIGALEIYTRQFQWVSVCSQGFDDSDAAALCTRLGYATGRARFYDAPSSSVGPLILFDTQCSDRGSPGLFSDRINAGICSFSFSSSLSCPSGEIRYAGLECISSGGEEGAIRLFGEAPSSGILEVFYNGKWGMVCSSSFGSSEAMTVCGGLGFHRPASSYTTSPSNSVLSLESNLKPIWLSNVECGDSSPSFAQCTQSDIVGYAPCTSLVSVTCENQFSAGEYFGIAFGTLCGIIIIFVIIWFSGLNKAWQQRNNNPKYKACIACCTSCGVKCKAGIAHQQEAMRARREASRARRQAQAEARQAQASQAAADIALQEELRVAEQNLRPSAPPEFSEKPPPDYSPGVGFEPLAADQPPPYSA